MRHSTIEEIRDIVAIDETRDHLLTNFAKRTLDKQFLLPGENYQDAFARASVAFCGGDYALAQRLYDYSSKLWFMFATPLLSNGGTEKGLPISCYLNYVDDSIKGLCEHFTENAFLSTRGGGLGSYWGDVRPIGDKSSKGVETPGVISFLHVTDAQMLAYHQGSTRRGGAAVYLDISHPEIIDFINMRSSTGDIHRKNENLHHGICIPDAFMHAVRDGGMWDIVDKHTKEIIEKIDARSLWIRILQMRVRTGEPYLFFTDTANSKMNAWLKMDGLKIHHANLCTEITLPTDKNRTAICCLSSINLEKFDEFYIQKTQFIGDLVEMLDNAIDVFIRKSPPELWRARYSAIAERSIGLGTMGFAALLQKKGLSFDISRETALFNENIYRMIYEEAYKKSTILAEERGEPSDIKGSGLRHAHLIAIAPNATTSIICGTSPSIEPLRANVFIQKTLSGSNLVKNKQLNVLLGRYGKDNDDTWHSILINNGSVQHLDFLSENEKKIFRTAIEIDQLDIIELASMRQRFICQAQSVNLFFPASISAKKLHKTHFKAWSSGLKSLYYLRSESVKSTEIISNKACRIDSGGECQLCEG